MQSHKVIDASVLREHHQILRFTPKFSRFWVLLEANIYTELFPNQTL